MLSSAQAINAKWKDAMVCNYDAGTKCKIEEYFGWWLLESVCLPTAFYPS